MTTFESSQRPTLLPIVIPEGDPMHGVGFHHCMKVFGASMWAVEKFSEPLLRHVASIAAEYLDNNEDGVVDDPAVNAALVDNYAAMYLVDAFDKFDKFNFSDQSPMHRFRTTIAQHSGETAPQGSLCGNTCGQPTDVTLEEVLHLIQQAGYSVGMSRALLKFNGGSVYDYATIADDSPRPSRASRARRAATSAGIS